MSFESLPFEIHHMIAWYLLTEDLQSLRLVSKDCSQISTGILFQKIRFRPTEHSQESIEAILAHFPTYVQTIEIQTCWYPDREFYNLDDGDTFLDGSIEDEFLETLRTIGRFSSLKRVSIHFSKDVRTDRGYHWEPEVREDEHIRLEIFEALVSGLSSIETPVNLIDLKIINWHTCEFDIIRSDEFQKLLKKLEIFHLKLTPERGMYGSLKEANLNVPEIHNFFKSFTEVWLRPLTNVKEISLGTGPGIYWGFWPGCDLRGLALPKLEKLKMKNWTISYKWQLDWLFAMKMLKSLELDDCPMHKLSRVAGPLIDGWMTPCDFGHQLQYEQTPIIKIRHGQNWTTFFRRVLQELPCLINLKIHRVDPDDLTVVAWENNYPDNYIVFDITSDSCVWHHEQEDILDIHSSHSDKNWVEKLEDLCKQQACRDELAWRTLRDQLSERRLSCQALYHASTREKRVSESEVSDETSSEEYEPKSHSEHFEVM